MIKYEDLKEEVKEVVRKRFCDYCEEEGIGGYNTVEEIDEMLEDFDNDYTEDGQVI